MNSETFKEVLAGVRAGGKQQLAMLFRAYNPMLIRFFRAQAGGAGEDLAQETWLSVAPNVRAFEGDERQFRMWLLSHARSVMGRHVSANGSRPVDPRELIDLTDRMTIEMGDATIADAAVSQLLDGLPPGHAEVLLLRVVGGLNATEAGALLGKSPGAIRVIQHRALKHLSDRLAEKAVPR